MKKNGLHCIKVLIIWAIATLSTLLLYQMNVKIENLLLLYVIGVVISIIVTSEVIWGIGSGILFAMTFNFLYTEPIHTFLVDDPNYLISIAIFVIVAIIVSTLTYRLQKEKEMAVYQQMITAKISEICSGFLNLTGLKTVISYTEESLYRITNFHTSIYIYQGVDFEDRMVSWCYHHGKSCGKGYAMFSNQSITCIPIKQEDTIVGVVSFNCQDSTLDTRSTMQVEMILTQLVLVLQRNDLAFEKEENHLQVEREKLKSTLLRNISHNLKQPLLTVEQKTEELYQQVQKSDKDTIKQQLKDINQNTKKINTIIENLLEMTKIEEGKINIKRKKELVIDIVDRALAAVSTKKENRTLVVEKPESILLFCCDGKYLVQVLTNILDNAFKHTDKDSKIILKVFQQEESIVFQVSDNGGGMNGQDLDHIFDDYCNNEKTQENINAGVGLTVAKAIIEAHDGTLTAYNNGYGGVTFEVTIPLEQVQV